MDLRSFFWLSFEPFKANRLFFDYHCCLVPDLCDSISTISYWYSSAPCRTASFFILTFRAFSLSSSGVCLIVMVLRKLGNFFLSGLVISLFVDDNFQAVSKYLFSTLFSFCSN